MKRKVLRESFRLHKTVDPNCHTSQEFSCSLLSPHQLALFIVMAFLVFVVLLDLASAE